MVEDAVRRVAVVDVAVEVAYAEVAAHKAAGAQGGAKQWRCEGAVDEDGDASRTKRVTPSNRQGRGEYRVCQTQQRVGDESTLQCCQYRAHKGEGPNHVSASEGPVEEVLATVAVRRAAEKKVPMQPAVVEGGAGDVVVLDEVEAVW